MPDERKDHVITEADFPKTAIARWDANIAAIRLSKALDAEGRTATPPEQKALAKYTGFGDSAFGPAFPQNQKWESHDPSWQGRKEALENLVSPEELEGIRFSRLNAFYTTPEVVNSMWGTLSQMGANRLDKPKVLEPSAGSGRFLGLQPKEMAAKSERTAVELDPMTGSILKHTYPETKVYVSGFEEAPIKDDYYDIAISNVPFGNVEVYDKEYNASGRKYLTNQIHNYFFAKSLDKLRPGGVVAYITTHGTMDAPTSEPIRRYLADRADLLGAVRLPEDAFPDTDVVTDIMYMRKREADDPPGDDTWVKSESQNVPGRWGEVTRAPINSYFLKNPDKVLGKHSGEGSMYRGGSYTVKSDPSRPVLEALDQEAREIVRDNAPIRERRVDHVAKVVDPKVTEAETPPKYVLEDGKVRVSRGGPSTSEHDLSANDAKRVTGLLQLRETGRRLIDQESGDTDNATVEATRKALSKQYDKFVETQGEAINTPGNRKLLGTDADDHLLFALENYDIESECWTSADIMRKRVVGAMAPQKAESASDALQVVMNEKGKLDFERMGEMMGRGAQEVRDELAQDKLIFKSPKSEAWMPATEYLTGNVREKLREAEIAAQAEPAYRDHVAALREVQPAKVTAEEISTPLGAPWIPADVVNDWVHQEFRLPYNRRQYGEYFRYLGETEAFIGETVNEETGKATRGVKGGTGGGSWTLAQNFKSDYADITYGTARMSAKNILLKSLQGAPITVTKPDPDGEGRVTDPEGTLEAQQKADEMQKAFNEWVWQDPERREQLEEKYNNTHNAIRPRVFDGSHQTFPGMAAQWQQQMHPHQRDAIFRTVHDGTTLLAHEVGFGKSATMIASAKERKRLGLANKPVFVVPKATHEQFTSQFMEVYPGARILTPDKTDFQTGNREAFLARIATGDWDGVILSYEQFEKIPLKPETESAWIAQQKAELAGSLMEMMESGDIKKGDTTQKNIAKKLNNYEVRLKQLADKMEARSDDTLTFEDLGVDQLYVDEADNFKNLPYVSRMASGRSGVKGLPQSEAQRAWDMYMKIRYLQDKSGKKPDGSFAKGGVVFATGTPVANTIAETYTMMKYLQPDELKRRGLESFDAWAKTYGHVKSGMEYTAGGKYKTVQRFSRFVNLPELSNLFQHSADIRVASEVPEMLAAQPRLVDEKGDPKRITVVAPSHPALQAYMADIIERVDELGKVPPWEDNMLKISGDARKAAMDVQMVNPSAPYNPEGKIPLAAENIARIFKQEEKRKGTQLVFLDLGTPKETTDTGADDTAPKDEEELTGEEKELLTNVYGRLRTELVNRGVPTEQVAFIHDHDTPVAREEILAKVRNGDVRVLIGSTQKIGVGINVEDHAAAAHHIDVPWRPRDVEQREGRVIRQGNKIYGPERDDDGKIIGPGRGVQVYQYVQAQSFDRFMWQAVEEKARGIKALMKRNQTHREMEDVDPLVIGASEAKALASGDPLAIRAEELRQKVDVGRLSRAAHKRRQFEAESQKRTLAPQIEAYEKSLPALQADAERVEALPEKADFTIQVGDRTFEKRADAGVALADLYGQVVREYKSQGHIPIGKYKGFDVAMNTDKGYQLTVVHPETQYPHEGSVLESDEVTPRGLMSRLDNLVRGLPARADKMQSNLDRAKENSRLYDDQLGKQYEGGAELDHGERQLRVIRAKLADDSTLLREGDDPDMDVQSDFAAAASIAVPAKAPAETPREIPDADPVDVRQAVEIARGEDQADTPREVASVLKEQIESPAAQARPLRPDAERRLAERKVMEAQDGEDEAAPQTDPAPTGSQELPGSADAPAPEAAAAASVTAPDSAEPTELKAPLSELDELAQEYNFGAYSSLNADLSAVILGLWRARNNVSDSTKVVPETPAAERPRVAITDVSLPLEDERPKPKAPAERLAEVEASDAYQETQKDENLMRAYMPEERDAVRESLSLKKEIREEKDQEELPDAEFQELREKALDATYRNELHLGKSEEQAREHMEYMRGLYQKNEGDVTRRRFEATIARSPDADTVKLKSVLDDVNKNRVRAKEEAAKYPELDGKVTLGELDAAIFSLHGANRSVKGRVGAGVSEDTPVSLVDAYQYGVLPDDAGLTGAQLREAFREAKIKAATPAKKTDIIADKDGIDRLVSMIPEQGVIDVDYLRRESGLGDAFDETLEAAKRRGNVALTDEGSGVMSVEWRDRHEERAPKPAAMTKPEAQAVKPKEEAVKTPAEDYMAVSREIEEVGGTPPKFKVSMKDLEAIRDDYKRMPPPTATASEMIEAAKDGPVALTGPGSIMNKLAEEEAAKRKRSIPSAARASATEVSDAADVLFGKLQADRAFQNALRHSDSQNAQIEYNNAMLRAVDRLLADGPMDLYKKLVDSPEFRERLDYHLRTRGIFNKPQDDKRAAEVKEKPPAPATPEPSVAIEPEQSAAPPPSGPMFWSDIQGEPKSKTQGQLWARDKERRQVVLDRLNGVEGDFFANAPFNAVEEERAKELFDKEREIIRTGHYGTWKDESRALQSARISMAERAKERQSPPEVPTRSDENWRERERQGELKELERIAVRADTQEERDFWQGVMHDVRTRDKRGPETQRVGEDYVKEELLRLGAYRAEMEGADLLREGEEPWQAAERVHADLAERRRAGAPPKPKDVQEAPPADTPKRERGEQRAEETPVTGDQVIERIRKERQESDATIKAAAKRQMDANEVVAASRALDRALETRHKASGASERKEAHAAVEEARSEYWETVAEAKGKREREKAARKEEPTPAPEPSAIEWEYHDKLAQVKKHTFQPNPGMKYDISEQGKYWRNTLWVEHPKGKTAMTPSGMTMGYYPPGDNRYESAEEAQAAAEKHYREWEASGEPAPRNQKFAGGGLFGGKKMSLEEMAESDVEAAKAKKNREKRDSRNEAARARRAAARPQKLVETWQEGPMSSEKADYDRNLAVLKRIPEDVFPLGEKTRIVGIWETAGDRFGAAPTAAEAPSKPKDVQESEPTPAKRERKPKGTPSAETAPAALAPEPVAETPAKPKKPTRKETAAAWVGKQKTPEAAAQKVQAHIAKLMQKEHLPQRQLQPWLDRQEAAQEAVSASKPEQKADVVPEQPKRQPASSVSVEGEPLYQGHKGPGIGYLQDVVPERRDGDGDTVVAERRPRKADEFKESPEPVPAGLSDKYRKIGSELTSRATAAKRGKGRRRRSKAAAPKLDSPQRPPSLKIVTR